MSTVVASYLYRDSTGQTLARIDRVEPGWSGRSKEFLPYATDGKGGYDEHPGLSGAKLPLYHLDQVHAAIDSGQAVYITEGEGKGDDLLDALRSNGSSAAVTTVQGGAMATLSPEHISSLAGAPRVIMLADSDDVGRRSARTRGQRIADAHPSCDVRVIDLFPDRNDGSDVKEWLGEGHAVRGLDALIKRTPRVELSPMTDSKAATASQKRRERPTFVRAGELLASADAQLEYAVEGLLPLGGTAVLAGRPKGGKSTLALNLALTVSRGEPFLGRATRKGPVLYLALEGAQHGWKALLRCLGVTNSDDLFVCIDRAPEAAISWLAEEIEKHKPVLVVVDTMQRLLRVKDGNDYATGSNATDAVIELARRANGSLLMLHHSGKTQRTEIVDEVMGSTAWAAAVDTVLLMRRSERYRTIASEQRFGENLPETLLTMDTETHRVEGVGPRIDADREAMREAIIAFLGQYAEAYPEQPFTDEPAINDGVSGKTQVKREALREAVARDEIARTGEGKKGDPYLYGLSCFLLPNHMREQENENPETDEKAFEIRSDSCSRDSTERPAKEQEFPKNGNENLSTADELFAYAMERIPPRDDAPPPTQPKLDL